MVNSFPHGLGRRIGHDGLARDLPGGGQVLFHQDGRERKHVADVVETVAGVIGGEIRGGLEVHTHQVANGVVVFDAIEAARSDAAWVGLHFAVEARELRAKPLRDLLDLLGRGHGEALGRHLAGAQFLHDFFPDVAILEGGFGVRIAVQAQPSGLHFGVVTQNAIGLEEGLDGVFEREAGRQTNVGCYTNESEKAPHYCIQVYKGSGARALPR